MSAMANCELTSLLWSGYRVPRKKTFSPFYSNNFNLFIHTSINIIVSCSCIYWCKLLHKHFSIIRIVSLGIVVEILIDILKNGKSAVICRIRKILFIFRFFNF